MTQQASALQRAVRFRVILKYFGQLCLVLSASVLVPLSVSLIFGDTMVSIRYTVILIGVLAVGGILARLRAPAHVQANEGMILAAFFFLLSPLLAAYPMMLTLPNFLDAVFEGMSAVTTTGLSNLTRVEESSSTFLFARAWMQWFGGFGIVALSLAWVVQPGMAAKGLSVTETDADDLIGGTRIHAQRTLAVYTILTGLGILILWALGVNGFHSVLYAFAAISTGGFSPHHDSATGLGGPVQGALILICLMGAFPLAFYHQLYRHKIQKIRKIRGIGFSQQIAVLLGGLIITVLLWACLSAQDMTTWTHSLQQASFLAFSAQTSAGFSNMSLADLDSASKLAMLLAMMSGATGSTTGGFKVFRLLILLRLLQLVIVRTCLPKNAVTALQLEEKRVQDTDIIHALLIILAFLMVIALSWMPFVAMGYDPLDSLFEVISATGTVGLSVGITSPDLPSPLKIILCLDMLMGRLEVLAWFVLFYPRTWFGRRSEAE